MQRTLDFDKTPVLGVPLPFLLNVPFFAVLAGLLATWAGPDAFVSRWGPATLALTHLWTLGILGGAMLGALMQILAVACNVPTDRARTISGIVHALLTFGTLVLVAGFIWWYPLAWLLAVIMLSLAFSIYIGALVWSLWRYRRQVYPGAREILVPLRGALLSLAITAAIGVALASALGLGMAPPNWTDTHVLWGLLGWSGLLIMGMSFQLLPIFQSTELYPKHMTRWLPLVVPALLFAWTALDHSAGLPRMMREAVELLLVVAYALWAGTTLYRLLKRKHPTIEPTTVFWYAAMASLLACVPLWLWLIFTQAPQATLVLGVVIIVGGLGSAVNGMLYKILPFLLWKHAQDRIIIPDDDPTQVRVYLKVLPKMFEYIPYRRAHYQFAIHLAVILSWTLAGAGWTLAAKVAGPLLLLSALWLTCNIAGALRLYRKTLKTLASMQAPLPKS